MIAVELNVAIQAHFATLGEPYSNVEFYPLYAYPDTEPPFIVYFEYPGTLGDGPYFVNIANVIYYIYDNDISRMKDVGYKLAKFLNVGDDVEEIKGLLAPPDASYGPLRYRLTVCRKVGGNMIPPLEREGFSAQSINFRTMYVDAF